jgi:hypothetical protein
VSTQEVLEYVQARPFRPFRIRVSGGPVVDIRHPEMIRVGTREIIIFKYASEAAEVYDAWSSVGLSLIESISHLDAQVA